VLSKVVTPGVLHPIMHGLFECDLILIKFSFFCHTPSPFIYPLLLFCLSIRHPQSFSRKRKRATLHYIKKTSSPISPFLLLQILYWCCTTHVMAWLPKGVPNGCQIASLGRILLAIKEREQIASDCQIASLVRSLRNNSHNSHNSPLKCSFFYYF
jgi:hypothetical protein